MPNWDEKPPKREAAGNLQLIRTPQGRGLQGIITSTRLIGCETHFVNRHTIPCEAPHCNPCSEGIPRRWHGYFGIYHPKTGKHVLLEVTAGGAEQIMPYYEISGTLRGCLLTSCRRGMAANSPLDITTRPADLQLIQLPPEPDLPKLLSMIWGINEQATRKKGFRAQQPEIGIDSNVTDLERDPILAAERRKRQILTQ